MDTWKTREGQEIPVVDMSDAHLQNAIRHMEKFIPQLEQRPKFIDYLFSCISDTDAGDAFPVDPLDGPVDPQVEKTMDGLIQESSEWILAKREAEEKLEMLRREAARRGLS